MPFICRPSLYQWVCELFHYKIPTSANIFQDASYVPSSTSSPQARLMQFKQLTVGLLALTAFAQNISEHGTANGNNKSVIDYFPQLSDVRGNLSSTQHPRIGQLDVDRCCRLAVYESVDVNAHGDLIRNPDGTSFIPGDLTTFLNASRAGNFACGATYSQGQPGAPLVVIPYWWCRKNCHGWSVSTSRKLNQWVSPLAGFIVPAVVFCLAIPRRRRIYLPENLFNVSLNKLTQTPSIILRAPIAALLVSFDTVMWLLVIFALAGPILLSGVFEALVDKRVLEYVEEKIRNGRLTTAARVRILYTVLLGNLDMNGEVHESEGAWGHLERHLMVRLAQGGAERTKTCLRAMLATQYSFGVTVGAPVVFFGASFVYTLVENYSQYGNNDLSLALAFGEIWQVIPHIAIVSGLLLAGNNPNTLEGVVHSGSHQEGRRILRIFAPAFESNYQPAWIWNRGRSKKVWFERLCKDYDFRADPLRDRLEMSTGDWVLAALMAYSMIVIPATLAFLTAYFTITIGLACRSFSFLMYMLGQFCLINLWIYDIIIARHNNPRRPSLNPRDWTKHRPQTYIWWTLVILCGSVSTFFAIGGTMMQIIGVFRNCLCITPLNHWATAALRQNFPIEISSNSAESIEKARTWWKGTGAGAVAFLGVSSFTGWWYQRLVRFQMKELVDRIDENPEGEKNPPLDPGIQILPGGSPETETESENDRPMYWEGRDEGASAKTGPEGFTMAQLEYGHLNPSAAKRNAGLQD